MEPSSALLAAVSGLGLGFALIAAIGAQNAFVLRQGLRIEHVTLVVSICVASDAALMVAGVAGAGAVVTRAPQLVAATRLVGALFLLSYGALAARRAIRPPANPAAVAAPTGRWLTAATCMALTWLNPHVYLDTVVLLGSIAASHGHQQWWFALGAMTASVAWFTGLGFGAKILRPLFTRAGTWRVLDAAIAVVMTALAVSLVLTSPTAG